MFTQSIVKIKIQTCGGMRQRSKHRIYLTSNSAGCLLQKRQRRWKSFTICISTSSPCALAISEAWLDDRAPDGRVVSGSSRAFTMDLGVCAMGGAQQQWGLLSHQKSVVQISSGNRDAPQSPKCCPCCLGKAIQPRIPFLFLHWSCRQMHYFLFRIQS